MKQPLMFVVVFVALILATYVPDRDPYLLRLAAFAAMSVVFTGMVAFFYRDERRIGRRQRKQTRNERKHR